MAILRQFMEDPPEAESVDVPVYLYAEGAPTKFVDELGLIALGPFKSCVVTGDVISSSEPADSMGVFQILISMPSETDARSITTSRTVDALDRVTLIDSLDNTLDTTYIYDDPAVPFSKAA